MLELSSVRALLVTQGRVSVNDAGVDQIVKLFSVSTVEEPMEIFAWLPRKGGLPA